MLKRSPTLGVSAAVAADTPTLDDAVAIALATNSLHALADLVSNPDMAERLRGKQFGKPTYEQKKVQARASVLLLRRELGVTCDDAIAACVGKLHFGGSHGTVSRVVRGAMSAALLEEAADLAKWICESPSKAAHLEWLASVKTDAASANTDADADEDDR